MTWWAWLMLGVYVAVGLWLGRRIAGEIAWGYRHYPDSDNVFGGVFVGVIAGIVWPVSLLICACCVPSLRYFVVEKIFWSPHDQKKMVELRR